MKIPFLLPTRLQEAVRAWCSPKNHTNRTLWLLVLLPIGLLVASAAFALVAGKARISDDPRTAIQTLPVGKVQEVARFESTFTGVIEPRVLSPMGFRVSGKVVKRYVDKGQSVKKGDPLMSLDPTDYALSATVAAEQLNADKAIKHQTEADRERFQAVVGDGAVSQSKNDATTAAADVSAANVLAAQSQQQIADNAKTYTTIYAEADGLIVDTMAEPGQVVSAGQPVVQLAFAGAPEAVVNLPESVLIDSNTTATAYLLDDESTPLKAHLRQMAAQADPILRTFEARFPLDGRPRGVRLGSTVTIKLSRASNAFQVPLGALLNRGQGYVVWQFDPKTSTVKDRRVTVQRITEDDAIISDGLSEGEQVVLAGAQRLQDGQKIIPSMN